MAHRIAPHEPPLRYSISVDWSLSPRTGGGFVKIHRRSPCVASWGQVGPVRD